MPETLGAPAGRTIRRARAHAGAEVCSCALLSTLIEDPALHAMWQELGITIEGLNRASAELHTSLPVEPADWQHRLEQRGARGSHIEHQTLLAIVRSPELHAYRLLDTLGLAPAKLRKRLVERISVVGRQQQARRQITPSKTLSTREGSVRRPGARQRLAGPETASAARPSLKTGTRPSRTPSRRPAGARPNPIIRESAREQYEDQHGPQDLTSVEAHSDLHAAEEETRLESIKGKELPSLFGRRETLEVLADALGRALPRPALLVGEVGSGRTKVAMHLAEVLDKPVFRLSLPRFDDEDLLRETLRQIAQCGGVAILDDLDQLTGETAPECLPALTQAWCSGPATLTIVSYEGRARLEAWLPGVLETLDSIVLKPLEPKHVRDAVHQAAQELLDKHGLQRAGDSPLDGLVRIADQHLTGIAMPGRALDLLDLACARTTRHGAREVHADAWIDIVCQRTGLSRGRVDGSGDQDVLDLDSALARYVVGHGDALNTIANLVRRNRAGFGGARPVASVLLLGPSGVGKTEIAKALAASLFDREDALVRLDMSEYSEAHAVARIVGAPPGYVGHEHGGALTDPLLAQPHRVVLLDEIEKAHRDVHQLMLQVFDEGRLTDGRGRTVDFRHALIVMTSNLGASLMEEDPRCEGEEILDEARSAFPIELWNRIEAPLVLRPLTSKELHKVCKRLVSSSSARLKAERGISYSLSEQAAAHLVRLAGDDPSLGARPLRHLLSREVEAFLADSILRGQLRAGSAHIVDHGIRGFKLIKA